MKFLESHEWVKMEGDLAVVGISNHAQEQLSDIVYVELPQSGDQVEQKKRVMSIESVKAASDIYSPVSGEIVEVNNSLEDTPELVNESPEDKGWLFKLKPSNPEEMDSLMDQEKYQSTLD